MHLNFVYSSNKEKKLSNRIMYDTRVSDKSFMQYEKKRKLNLLIRICTVVKICFSTYMHIFLL